MDVPKTLEALLEKKPRKAAHTISVDAETFSLIDQVSRITTKSRPAVLAAFVSTSYDQFIQKARDSGVVVDRLAIPLDLLQKRGRPFTKNKPRLRDEVPDIKPPDSLVEAGLVKAKKYSGEV